jgi:hypothetical protein
VRAQALLFCASASRISAPPIVIEAAPTRLPFRILLLASRNFQSRLSKNGIELIRTIANDVFFGPL